jgi:hypothetical protein
MATSLVDRLFFRFWVGNGVISEYACPLRETPHYRFALSALQNINVNPLGIPEGSGYHEYVQWEAVCYGRSLHDELTFAAKIISWGYGFSLKKNPIDVAEFAPEQYFILDGTHRAAYAAALLDLGNKCEVVIRVFTAGKDWPDIVGIKSIEAVIPNLFV